MLQANLYIDRIDLARYLTPEEVRQSGARDSGELAARLKDGSLGADGLPLVRARQAPCPVPGAERRRRAAPGAIPGTAPPGAAGAFRHQRARPGRHPSWFPGTANSP